MSDHIASRLAIHESCHATAMFLLNMPIRSIQIGENEGVVHHPYTDDSFDNIVSLLAPHRLEDAYGWEPSGDDWDEKEVTRILRKHVSVSAIPQARAVLEEAADQLVLSSKFDTLRRALSRHLKPGTYMTGPEAEEILLEAYEKNAALMAPVKCRELHGRARGPAHRPWFEVTLHGKLLYRGADERQAKIVQSQNPGSLKVGSIYG
jgi:hypothetical protein